MVGSTRGQGRSFHVSLDTIFFLQRYHILPPIFSLVPSIFPEYTTEDLFHTIVEHKSELRGRKVASECVFGDFSARNLSREVAMRNQQSTQPISCLDIVDPKRNRKTARTCSAESLKRLEYEDIPDLEYRKDVKHPLYSEEYTRIRSCQTPPIFRNKFRNNV